MADSEIVEYLVRKQEERDQKSVLFTESEEKNARATWYKMKLHQFFKKHKLNKNEWRRMINPVQREKYNDTHQTYKNLQREYFIMPSKTWEDLAKANISSEEFRTVNDNNDFLVKYCRGLRLNYSSRRTKRTIRKPNATTVRNDLLMDYVEHAMKYFTENDDTPSIRREKTRRIKSKKNMTVDEEIYRALGGPLPYDPDFWPESFLRSNEVFNNVFKKEEEEYAKMNKKERKQMLVKILEKEDKKEREEFERNESLIRQGKYKGTPPDLWGGYTGIHRKIWEYYRDKEERRIKAREARQEVERLKQIKIQKMREKKIIIDVERNLNETTNSKKYSDNSKVSTLTTKLMKIVKEKMTRKRFEDESRERKAVRKENRKSVIRKRNKLNQGIRPPNEISRRERAKNRDKMKYGSEYSRIMTERYRRKMGYLSRSRETWEQDSKRSKSREKRPHDKIRGTRTGTRKRNEYYDDGRRKYVDSRDRKRSSSSESRSKKRKPKRINKGRPERFRKKKPEPKKKKKRPKREISTVVRKSTTVDPIFFESRSEYQGKMVIDEAFLTRRRAYLAEKYARLDRLEIEKKLRRQGKLKKGETITTVITTERTIPSVESDTINPLQLEMEFMNRGLTRQSGFRQDNTYASADVFDEGKYEKAEREYMKNKKGRKRKSSSESDESEVNTMNPDEDDSILDVEKYEKEEQEYMKQHPNETSSAYSYMSPEDKSYVTDHNPDYGSQERLDKFEENLIIDYKNKEVHFKNSPRIKYSKEDPRVTIPTWPTKRKNRGVRPQDRKLCFFNPSTTNTYRQVLYVYHKYNQLKAAFDRKENIDDIPSLDSDY